MKDTQSAVKDPVCGMTVDAATAMHAEREGETYYFCSDHCRKKFLAMPDGTKPTKSGGCCG